MRMVFAVWFLAHGVAHLPDSLVSWQLRDFSRLPFHTTVLGDSVDIGTVGNPPGLGRMRPSLGLGSRLSDPGEWDADTRVLLGNLRRGDMPRAAGGGTSRSATRAGVLQGSPRALRARRWPSLGRVGVRTDGDRRQADADVRHQPARTGRGSAATARSRERPRSGGA